MECSICDYWNTKLNQCGDIIRWYHPNSRGRVCRFSKDAIAASDHDYIDEMIGKIRKVQASLRNCDLEFEVTDECQSKIDEVVKDLSTIIAGASEHHRE